MTGNAYKVKDASTGETAFHVEGNIVSWRHRMTIKNGTTGDTICFLVKDQFAWTDSYSVWTLKPNYAGQKSEMDHYGTPTYKYAQMEKHLVSWTTTLTFKLARPPSDTLETVATIRAEPFSFKYDATCSDLAGRPIATFDQTQYFQLTDEYALKVKQGNDPLSMILLTIAMDHLKEVLEKRKDNN